MNPIEQAQDYLMSLTYDWHDIADIPEEIKTEVLLLIDESYICRYWLDNFGRFRKRIFTKSSLNSF